MNREEVARRLKELAGVARSRNGRLAVNWLSRQQKPRWRMVRMDSEWYDRDRMRDWTIRRGEFVPVSRRALTVAELVDLRDPNPWGLLRNTTSKNVSRGP